MTKRDKGIYALSGSKTLSTYKNIITAYHSENYESIYWYLKQANKNLNIVTIHNVSQEDVSKLEKDNTGKADFTICVDEDMTKTR